MSVDLGGFFFQAEDGIRDLVRSRGLGDVYKRQEPESGSFRDTATPATSDGSRSIRVTSSTSSTPTTLSLIHI